MSWTVLLAVGPVSYALKVVGPVLAGGRQLGPRLRRSLDLVAVPLLAALTVVHALGDGHRLVLATVGDAGADSESGRQLRDRIHPCIRGPSRGMIAYPLTPPFACWWSAEGVAVVVTVGKVDLPGRLALAGFGNGWLPRDVGRRFAVALGSAVRRVGQPCSGRGGVGRVG